MGKFEEFNELGVAVELNRERLSETKKNREEAIAEVNRKYDEIEKGYSSWLDEYLPKYRELARDVYLASQFKLVDVAYIAADIISAFKGEEYFFQKAEMVHYVGWEKTQTKQVLDVLVAEDSAAAEYSPAELSDLLKSKKMIVLADEHVGNVMFSFYESDEDGNLKFNDRFYGFEFVTDFFKSVIAERADVRPELPYSFEILDKLKNKYLLDNIEKIRVISDRVESEDKKEYDEVIDKALLKLNVKKEFRAKMLTKIREFSNDEEETNS